MKKHMVMFGVMAAGALAVVGKRTYDLVKIRKSEEPKREIVEVQAETTQE